MYLLGEFFHTFNDLHRAGHQNVIAEVIMLGEPLNREFMGVIQFMVRQKYLLCVLVPPLRLGFLPARLCRLTVGFDGLVVRRLVHS